MKIVFFGSPATAIPSLERLLENGHSVGLIVTQPEKPAGRGLNQAPSAVKRYALDKGIPVIEPEKIRRDATVLERLTEYGPDINIVVAYGQIIPSSILYLPPSRTLNVHFSLLPKFRGAAPVQWSILSGERTTGVTIMELNEKMDEGDILQASATDILPGETASDLEKRLAVVGADLLIETLRRIKDVKPVPQDHSLATYAPKLKKEDARIAWTEPAALVERKFRAYTSRPGSFAFFRGKRLIILRGAAGSPTGGAERVQGPPGAVISCSKKGIEIACGDGAVFTIEELKPEGRGAMNAHAFALGARIRDGELFD